MVQQKHNVHGSEGKRLYSYPLCTYLAIAVIEISTRINRGGIDHCSLISSSARNVNEMYSAVKEQKHTEYVIVSNCIRGMLLVAIVGMSVGGRNVSHKVPDLRAAHLQLFTSSLNPPATLSIQFGPFMNNGNQATAHSSDNRS